MLDHLKLQPRVQHAWRREHHGISWVISLSCFNNDLPVKDEDKPCWETVCTGNTSTSKHCSSLIPCNSCSILQLGLAYVRIPGWKIMTAELRSRVLISIQSSSKVQSFPRYSKSVTWLVTKRTIKSHKNNSWMPWNILDVIRKLNSTCSNWFHSICHNNYVIILGFLVTQKVTIKMIKLWLPLNHYIAMLTHNDNPTKSSGWAWSIAPPPEHQGRNGLIAILAKTERSMW